MLSLKTVVNVKFVVLYLGPSSQMVTKIFLLFGQTSSQER